MTVRNPAALVAAALIGAVLATLLYFVSHGRGAVAAVPAVSAQDIERDRLERVVAEAAARSAAQTARRIAEAKLVTESADATPPDPHMR